MPLVPKALNNLPPDVPTAIAARLGPILSIGGRKDDVALLVKLLEGRLKLLRREAAVRGNLPRLLWGWRKESEGPEKGGGGIPGKELRAE